eukprot:COSAG01_NODE_10407_length_2174_cov_7.993735_2_plen_157_part_00
MVGALSGAATCTTTYRRVNVAARPRGAAAAAAMRTAGSPSVLIIIIRTPTAVRYKSPRRATAPRFRWRPRPIPHWQVGLQGVRGAHAAACEAVFAPLAPWGGLLPLLWLFRGVCDGSSSSARRRPCTRSRFISSPRWSSDALCCWQQLNLRHCLLF